MHEFLGPFLFGMSWLALALLALWLLRRSPDRRVSLRSQPARATVWLLLCVALAAFAVGLPYSLGLCRGGFDDPVTCTVIPAGPVEALSPLSLLLNLGALFAAPLLAATALLLEALKRGRTPSNMTAE